MTEQQTYSIAQLAEEFDVTTRTIRFYEDKDLIHPTRVGQRRIYSARDRVRLRLIMRGKRLGFSLAEIQEMIDLYDSDKNPKTQLHLVLERVAERRQALKRQQDDIETILQELDQLEEKCRLELGEGTLL